MYQTTPSLPERIGRYEILSELGCGAIGRVYLARDPNIGRRVALKVLLPVPGLALEDAEELADRFLLEARAAGSLTHPGIVTVHDAGIDGGSGLSYIAMEWVQGASLLRALKRHVRLPVSAAIALVQQVAVALDYAHRRGVVHRDVKPANILIGLDGKVRLTDFGIAKVASLSQTMSGQILGTPYYMSPEQITSDTVDGRSDLFSLGAVLYECLTGATPFGGDSMARIMYKILHVEPPPPKAYSPSIRDELCDVTGRALAKVPADRFQTGLELANALRSLVPEPASQPEAELAAVVRVEELSAATDTAGGARETDDPTVPLGGRRKARPRADGRLSSVVIMSRRLRDGASTVLTWASTRPWSLAAALLPVALLVVILATGASGGLDESGSDPPPGVRPAPELIAPPQVRTPSAEEPKERPAPRKEIARQPRRVDDGASQAAAAPAPEPEPVAEAGERLVTAAEDEPWARVEVEAEATPPVPPLVEVEEETEAEEARHTPPGESRASAALVVYHENRMRRAELSVWIDGERITSQLLSEPHGFFKRLADRVLRREVQIAVPVPPGEHVIEVRIRGAGGKLEASESIVGAFRPGRTRGLKVALSLRRRSLRLDWKD